MAIEYNQKGIASKKQNNRDFTLSPFLWCKRGAKGKKKNASV